MLDRDILLLDRLIKTVGDATENGAAWNSDMLFATLANYLYIETKLRKHDQIACLVDPGEIANGYFDEWHFRACLMCRLRRNLLIANMVPKEQRTRWFLSSLGHESEGRRLVNRTDNIGPVFLVFASVD